MKRLCLDTSGYSQFERGHPEALRVLDEAREVLVPVVTLGELRIGFRLGSREAANEKRLQQFLSRPVVSVVSIGPDTVDHYADITVELRKSGKKASPNDIWVAACAAEHGATVLTFDEHFLQIRLVAAIVLKP